MGGSFGAIPLGGAGAAVWAAVRSVNVPFRCGERTPPVFRNKGYPKFLGLKTV